MYEYIIEILDPDTGNWFQPGHEFHDYYEALAFGKAEISSDWRILLVVSEHTQTV
jgi:hypothetical protein